MICIPPLYQTFAKLAFNDSLELCENGEENYRMGLKYIALVKVAKKVCSISCIRTEYVGRLQFVSYPSHGSTIFWHLESDVQVYEEYLIYDVNGMIGSIGGLLGLFLGFSFLDFILYFIEKIQNRIDQLSEGREEHARDGAGIQNRIDRNWREGREEDARGGAYVPPNFCPGMREYLLIFM